MSLRIRNSITNAYIDKVLEYCQLLLHRNKINLSDKYVDGRINSVKDEAIIRGILLKDKALASRLKEPSDPRAFGDIYLDMSEFKVPDFPINIKSFDTTNKNQRNNLCGIVKLINYMYNDKSCRDKVGIARAVKTSPIQIQRYGLIIVSKTENKVWCGTFDEVPTTQIFINPSNGFQISYPVDRIKRNDQQYMKMVTDKTHELFQKWAEPLKVFEH